MKLAVEEATNKLVNAEMKELENSIVWSNGEIEYENRLIQKAKSYHKIVIFGAGMGGMSNA